MDRKKYIGGSDIATICGVSPYKTLMQVYAEKKGIAAPFQGNERTEVGQELEAFVRDVKFGAKHPDLFRQLQLPLVNISHPRYDFMSGRPDAYGDDFILEVKTCGYHSFKKLYDTEEAPDFVVCQANWYAMLVEEAEGREIKSIWIAVLGDTHLYREWNIEKDSALISIMMEQAIGFWENNILANNPPEADSSEHCTKALAALYPKHVTESLDAGTGPETQLLLDLKGATEDLKEAKEKVAGLENRIRAAIGSRIGIETDICRVTWKDQEKVTLSRKDLLNDPGVKQYVTPELKAKYTTVTQMKVLRKKWL